MRIHKYNFNRKLEASSCKLKATAGFTLMEVIVATSIFATTITLMLGLFNMTLRIQRRTEALRQVSQAVRNVSEFLVKEIRNGQLDYNIRDGQITVPPLDVTGTVCPPIATVVPSDPNAGRTYFNANANPPGPITDRFGLINLAGERECIAYDSVNQKLVIKKENVLLEDLTPPNVRISYLKFYIRPLKDPYTDIPVNSLIEVQPMVTILMTATATLPTGESRTITYQTSISTNIYNIPNQ